jgi:hypothetical protein
MHLYHVTLQQFQSSPIRTWQFGASSTLLQFFTSSTTLPPFHILPLQIKPCLSAKKNVDRLRVPFTAPPSSSHWVLFLMIKQGENLGILSCKEPNNGAEIRETERIEGTNDRTEGEVDKSEPRSDSEGHA